ncbi:MAG: hypothetical protein SGARI_004564 [Bacillariaceae sp.]
MEERCPRSCRRCPDQVEEDLWYAMDMGVEQKLWSEILDVSEEETDELILAAREYMKTVDLPEELRADCRNEEPECALWAAIGECESNAILYRMHTNALSYRILHSFSLLSRLIVVIYNCGPMCKSCEMLTVEGRCKIDPDAVPIWKEGSLDAMFTKLTSEPYKSEYDVEVISREPWIITMENILSDDDADHIVELGHVKGYKRSMNVGEKQADGSYGETESIHRTSYQAWCQKGCKNDTAVLNMHERLTNLTGIPSNNAEFIQLLRYVE